jgi:hypothetical protein
VPDGIGLVRAVTCGFVVALALGSAGARVSRREPVLAGVAVIVAFVWGLIAGLLALPIHPTLPPATALDRYLVILLPVALAIEAEAAAGWLGGFWLTAERGFVALIALPVLLHGSVWLTGGIEGVWIGIVAAALVLFAAWEGTAGHVRATGDRLVATVSVAAIAAGGLAIILAGWLKGGMVALLLAASLGGALLVAWRGGRGERGDVVGLAGLSSVGIVALFGLVVVGRCFGRLGTASAALLLAAPLLVALADGLSRSGRDTAAARLVRSTGYRVVLAAVPIVIVLVAAKADFDAKLGRLLVPVPSAVAKP